MTCETFWEIMNRPQNSCPDTFHGEEVELGHHLIECTSCLQQLNKEDAGLERALELLIRKREGSPERQRPLVSSR